MQLPIVSPLHYHVLNCSAPSPCLRGNFGLIKACVGNDRRTAITQETRSNFIELSLSKLPETSYHLLSVFTHLLQHSLINIPYNIYIGYSTVVPSIALGPWFLFWFYILFYFSWFRHNLFIYIAATVIRHCYCYCYFHCCCCCCLCFTIILPSAAALLFVGGHNNGSNRRLSRSSPKPISNHINRRQIDSDSPPQTRYKKSMYKKQNNIYLCIYRNAVQAVNLIKN